MRSRAGLVVFSNLDGTRFDPYFDAFGALAGMFTPFGRAGVPVVFFSSRTAAELRVIQRRLGLCHPFAAENGSALFVPRGCFGCDVPGARASGESEIVTYGRPYTEIVKTLLRDAAAWPPDSARASFGRAKGLLDVVRMLRDRSGAQRPHLRP